MRNLLKMFLKASVSSRICAVCGGSLPNILIEELWTPFLIQVSLTECE
jgi:hypothetical protein